MGITCKIELDGNPQKIVYSGQILRGTVHLSLTEEKTVRGVKIHIVGESRVKAELGDTTYILTDDVLNYEMYVIGSSDDSSKIQLTPGVHTFQFQYILSPDIPSTINEKTNVAKASTTYGIRVVVDVSFWRDKKFITPFTVITPRYLSTDQTPTSVKKSKRFSSLFCNTSDPLEIVGRLPVGGYCAGETINLELKVKNRSHQTVTKFTVKLVKRVICFYEEKLKDYSIEETTISSQETRGCNCNEDQKIQLNMLVPSTLPTYDANLINVEYFIKITGHVGFWHFNPKLRIPIEIGTVPFRRDIPTQVQFTK